MHIKDISLENRPRERLEKQGASTLSDAELLAVILKTGSKEENVIDMSNRLISKYGIDKLSSCLLKELQEIKGIGKSKASQILALFEFNKRHNLAKANGKSIKSAKYVFSYVPPKLSGLDKECFISSCSMSRACSPNSISLLTVGSNLLFTVLYCSLYPSLLSYFFNSLIKDFISSIFRVHIRISERLGFL